MSPVSNSNMMKQQMREIEKRIFCAYDVQRFKSMMSCWRMMQEIQSLRGVGPPLLPYVLGMHKMKDVWDKVMSVDFTH